MNFKTAYYFFNSEN